MKRNKTIHNEQYIDFIDNLCLERKRLGLPQSYVASRLGMTQSEISKIENKERRIDILELKELLLIYRMKDNTKLKFFVLTFFELD